MPPIIECEQLSKEYRFGRSVDRNGSARELMMRALSAPFRKRDQKKDRDKDHFWAVKDISFKVDAGEIVGIIGANGAGKSTLLKILSRITNPTEGKVTLRGRMASLLEVGTGFHPELTGRENVFLNGAVLGMRNAEIKARFDEIVAFSEVEKFIDTPVKHYSSGMSVRLGFAVAAHLQPEILVVDEVLAVGDMAFQKKCLGKMSEVGKGGRTVLFVSHNMAAVQNLCKRGIVLEHGRLTYDGETKGAIGRYLASAHRSGDGDSHVVNLSEFAGRKPKFDAIIRRVELFTGEDEPAPRAVQVGSRLKLKFHLRLAGLVQSFKLGVGFNSLYGQRVLTLQSAFDPTLSYEPLSGEQVLVCDVPSFPLVPGQYTVTLFLDFSTERKDFISEAFTLSVVDCDYYGTGKTPLTGVFVLPQRWALESAAEPIEGGLR